MASVPVAVYGHTEDDPALYPLVYGATEVQIGWVKVYNDATQLSVEYAITATGWGIKESHLLVTVSPIAWTSSGDYPPGNYTYQHTWGTPYPATDPYQVDQVGSGQFGKDDPWVAIGDLPCGQTLYLVAHAAVIGPTGQAETAFAGGFRNADSVITYQIQCEDGVEGTGDLVPGQPGDPSVPALPLLAIPAGIAISAIALKARKR